MFALFVGFEIPNSSGETGTILDSYGDAMDDINTGISNAGGNTDKAIKKAKEWKNVLLGFDVATVLPDQSSTDSSGSGGSGSGGTGGLSVDPRILDALNKYKYLFDDIHMKAVDIRDELLKWADIAGKAFNENIFKPISNSWNKYGASIVKNMKDSFQNIRSILSGVADVLSDKWKPFFSAASDLFFSLLDTATLVTSTITTFLRNVWDSGGNYFLEGIFDLVTAFIELATAINDDFIKPVVSGFKNTFGVILGKVLGTVLGLIGKFMSTLSDVIKWVSKSKTAIKLLGTALTTVFTIIQIGKFTQLWNTMSKGLSVVDKLTSLFVEHTKIGARLFDSYVNGKNKFDLLKNAWNSGLGVIGNLFGKLRDSVSQTTAYQRAIEAATTSTTNMSIAQKLCSSATVILQNALNFLASHPLIAVGTAIGVVVGALALFSDSQTDATEKIKNCSSEIQEQYAEVEKLADSIDSTIESVNNQSSSTLAQVEAAKKYIDILKDMEDEDGYVNNISSAKILIQDINKILPDTVSITEDGKIEWKLTNDQLEKNIDLLKKQAEQQAYQETYTELLKTQIELGTKLNEQKAAQKKAQDEYNEAVRKENDFFEERHLHSKTLQEDVVEAGKKLREHNALVEASQQTYDEAKGKVENFEMTLEDVIGSLEETSNATVELSESTKTAFENIGKNGQKSIKDMINSLKDYDKKINETSKKQDENSKNQVKTLQNERNQKLLEYGKLVRDYELTYDQIINLAESNGVIFSSKEKATLESIVQTYKNKGTEAGDKYVSSLSSEINNDSYKTADAAKNNVSQANNALSKVPIKYLSVVEEAVSKAQKVRDNAQKNVGSIKISTKVQEAVNAKSAGKRAGSSFKSGFVAEVVTTIGAVIGNATSNIAKVFGFASGGFPDVGQMFIARERGPELVGTMGGRTAVANNYQIENGIYRAVRQAMMEGKAYDRGGDLYITIQNEDGSKIEKVIRNYNNYMKQTGGKGGFNI